MAKQKFDIQRGSTSREALQGDCLARFKEGLSYDWSIAKCCYYAGIDESTYYKYVKRHPRFADEVAILRESACDAAQQLIAQKAKCDVNTAKWVLERRRKERYAPAQQLDVKHTHKLDNQLLDTIKNYQESQGVIEAEIIEEKQLPDIG